MELTHAEKYKHMHNVCPCIWCVSILPELILSIEINPAAKRFGVFTKADKYKHMHNVYLRAYCVPILPEPEQYS